nr:sarcospan isoform X2 [Peromyscus maniculatus bairdii]
MGRKPSPGAQERVDEEARTCCGCRFPLLLALLQLALGIAVTVLGFLMASISPSLLVRDTPFWAGIIVLYFLLSALGLMVCMLAVAFAAHHCSLLAQFTCETSLDSCLCKLPSSEPLSRTFVYRDVADCTSITGTFKLFLIIQMVLNLVCGLVCLLACFVMWKHRYQVFYVGVGLRSLMTSDGQQQKT